MCRYKVHCINISYSPVDGVIVMQGIVVIDLELFIPRESI